MDFALSETQLARYRRDGYLIVERLFDFEEIALLGRIARADHRLEQQAASRRDGEGGVIRLSVRNALGDDIYQPRSSAAAAIVSPWSSSWAARSTITTTR